MRVFEKGGCLGDTLTKRTVKCGCLLGSGKQSFEVIRDIIGSVISLILSYKTLNRAYLIRLLQRS